MEPYRLEARNCGLLAQGPRRQPPELPGTIGYPVEEWSIELLPNDTDEDRAALARDYRAGTTK